MVDIVFYEKPGCINNSKQKKLLIEAGHQVESRNLLTEQWSRDALLKFLDSMQVNNWFNYSAPEIKSGQINPDSLSKEDALKLMINNPILIRRPLMRVADEYRIGFEKKWVDQWIGLINVTGEEDLQNCPQRPGHSCNEPDSK